MCAVACCSGAARWRPRRRAARRWAWPCWRARCTPWAARTACSASTTWSATTPRTTAGPRSADTHTDPHRTLLQQFLDLGSTFPSDCLWQETSKKNIKVSFLNSREVNNHVRRCSGLEYPVVEKTTPVYGISLRRMLQSWLFDFFVYQWQYLWCLKALWCPPGPTICYPILHWFSRVITDIRCCKFNTFRLFFSNK